MSVFVKVPNAEIISLDSDKTFKAYQNKAYKTAVITQTAKAEILNAGLV